MFSYCLKCKNNTKNVDAKMLKIKNGKTILSSKRAACCSRKSRFMKEQEASGLLNSLGVKMPLINIPLLGKILLYNSCYGKFIPLTV